MPSLLVPQGRRVGARIVVRGREVWLGTFDTEQEALAAVARAKAKKPKRRQPLRRRPPSVEVCTRLAAAMGPLETFTLVALWSGLRLFEVAALEWRDVDFDAATATARLHVRHGKGDKERWSMLFPPGVRALDPSGMYRADALIFRNGRGNAWDRKAVNKHWCQARAEVAGCEKVTFHALRRAHCSWLLDQGASDLDCAVQLGHIDQHGRPDAELVRRIYGFPDLDEALRRVRAAGVGTVSA